MDKRILIFATLLLAASAASAQTADQGEVRAGINVAVGVPQGALGDHLGSDGYGLDVFVGGAVPGSPLVLGSEIGFLNYGTDSRLSIARTVFDDGISRDLSIPVEALNIGVSNNIIMGHLVARLQPSLGVFQPYIEGLAGLKVFMTHVDVQSDVVVFRDGLSQDSRITDAALSYGAGAGIELLVYNIPSTWKEDPSTVSLIGGVRYLFGTRAEYVREGSLQESGGSVLLDVAESRTDMLVVQFGLRVRR